VTELILALDITPAARALEVAAGCAPHLDAIKVGYPLVLSAGLSIADDLAALGPRLIADFKVADIPNTNRLICEEVFSAGFDAVIVHGFTGADAVQACVDASRAHGGSAYVVAEMSHPGAVEFFHAGVAERLAGLAVACGADGIIAPATRPERVKVLRSIVGDRTIYSPGVGAQGGKPDAVAGLADGIIVGRMIYEADDPAAIAASIAAAIRR
jgi:orotidine-5'-phosphate decarboxylase